MRRWSALFLCGLGVAGAFAQDDRLAQEAEAKRRLEALRSELQALQVEREAARGERGGVTRALRDADVALGAVARETGEVEEAIAAQQRQLDALSLEAAALATNLAGQRAALAALVRSAYVLGRHSELKLVFAPEQIGTLARLLAYHRYLQQDRARRMAAIAADLQRLAEVGRAIEGTRLVLVDARAELAGKQASLAAERSRQRDTLSAVEARLTSQAERVAMLGKDEKALLQLLERLSDAIADIPKVLDGSAPFGSARGRLPWPVQGKIAARFGSTGADGRLIEGLLIGARTGTRVAAVSHGRVAYADWLKGYGLLVIVEHGDGYMTLYAHNESLLKDVGEWVAGGDPIATVGASGGSPAAGVYFELRRNGSPVDPAIWLAKR